MGSKNRIAKYIVPIIQKYIDDNNIKTYYEQFVCGANVIDKIKCENRIGSDLNRYLIELLIHVKKGNALYESVSRELYNSARKAYNEGNLANEFTDWELGNIGFLSSYNGRWFDGGYAQSGYEKTKKGMRFRDYYRESKDNLLKQAPLLLDIKFFCCDYKSIQPFQSVVYCDPPYMNTKKYANSVNFDYDDFWNCMREWSVNNIVLISELEAPDDFKCIWSQEVSRSIKACDKSKTQEKLFVHNTIKS